MFIHMGEKPYNCYQCEQSFITNSYLKRHLKTHTVEKPYKCTKCDNAFTRKNELKKHMISHTSKSNFSPTRDSDLKMHSMPHTTEETQINQDPKSYPACSDLKSSTAVHMDKNPYQCNQCDSSFSNDVDLICHMSLHTIEKNINAFNVMNLLQQKLVSINIS